MALFHVFRWDSALLRWESENGMVPEKGMVPPFPLPFYEEHGTKVIRIFLPLPSPHLTRFPSTHSPPREMIKFVTL